MANEIAGALYQADRLKNAVVNGYATNDYELSLLVLAEAFRENLGNLLKRAEALAERAQKSDGDICLLRAHLKRFSGHAASVWWDGSKNTREWLDEFKPLVARANELISQTGDGQ